MFPVEIEPEFTKISLRATNDVNVNAIAQVFDGGGHAKASGCKLRTNFESAKEQVLNECRKTLEGRSQ